MNIEDRKAARRAYKERKPAVGIYAVRCAVTGEAWVGASTHLDKVKNRIWFTLKLGTYPVASLQDAWHAHGGDAFSFEEVERLTDEEAADGGQMILGERLTYWADELEAQRI